MIETEIDRRVRLSITRFFAVNGFAPGACDIAKTGEFTRADVDEAIGRLGRCGQLLLGADGKSLRSAHPYSATPTGFWVECKQTGWWANCAFCALGVAVIAAQPTKIYARLGGMSESVTLSASDDRISDSALRLHIPLPVQHWHDDIVYTCSNVHLFRDANAVDDWAIARQLPRGLDISLHAAWRLARAWYANYLDDNWTPHSADSLRKLCGSCGLTGEFWEPAP